MDVLTLCAALLGLAGVVLGFLGWQQAREAKRIAERAYSEATQTKTAPRDGRPASATHPTAIPPVSQPLPDTPPAIEVTQQPPRTGNTAHIVVRSGSVPGNDLPTNQGSRSGLIGVFLVNDGPAVAHDMQLHAIFPNGTRRSSELHRTLTAHKELTLFAQVVSSDFGANDPVHLHYSIAYRDGNGAQLLERDVRLEGGWKGPWRTFIEADSERRIEV